MTPFPTANSAASLAKVTLIGSDALAPTETTPYYSFPAKIRLDQQTLPVHGKPMRLQAGMSVNVLIKIRTRRVISIFTVSCSALSAGWRKYGKCVPKCTWEQGRENGGCSC